MTTHRYHPATSQETIDSLIADEVVPSNFSGDDPDAILFDHCPRCEEHTERPDLTLDSLKQARLIMRGRQIKKGVDFWRSARESEAEAALYRFKPRPI